MACPICGAKCVCRKRGEDGRCCPCHKHKSRTAAQAAAHQEHDRKQRESQAAGDLLAELGAQNVERRDGFTYPGLFARPVVTDLRIIRDGPRPVVIATERADNPGASITNTVESLAAAVSKEWAFVDFILVEHYPADRYGEKLGRSLSRVNFEREWSGVSWSHLEVDGLRALIEREECPCLSGEPDKCATVLNGEVHQ